METLTNTPINQFEKKVDGLIFVNQFNVLDLGNADDDINCKEISKLLYEALLTRFKIQIIEETNEILFIYQNRVYDMIDEMRDLDSEEIRSILKILDEENPCLADIVIMCWCLPRVSEFMSKNAYNNNYRMLIKNYGNKLTDIVDFFVIDNFCIETLTKTNCVPVHCIDLLWYYMNGLSIDFLFNDDKKAEYIEIDIDNDPEFTLFGFHLEFLLGLGLGRVNYPSDPLQKGTFKDFAKNQFVTNTKLIESSTNSEKIGCKNYIKQIKKITSDPIKYFDSAQ